MATLECAADRQTENYSKGICPERTEKYQAGIALLRAKGETIVEVDANSDFEKVLAHVLEVLKTQGPDWLHIQPPLLLDWRDADSSN